MFPQVLAFFSARLEQHPDQTLSVGVVLDVIMQGALQWPKDRLKVSVSCKYSLNYWTQLLEHFIYLFIYILSLSNVRILRFESCFFPQKFPELKFKYVEEEQPEEFFIPYVWSLVYKSSLLYWNPEHIEIFHPDT